MNLLRRLCSVRVGPDILGASFLQGVLTVVGVFTFLAGVLYLPSLEPTRMEAMLFLLLLAVVALLCATLGQLGVVAERLERVARKDTQPRE
jgi:hypothetical protein